jgi:hypothetical protein
MSNYAITDERGTRIGTIAKFAGNPASRRWVAFCIDKTQESFPTQTKAMAWMTEKAAEINVGVRGIAEPLEPVTGVTVDAEDGGQHEQR